MVPKSCRVRCLPPSHTLGEVLSALEKYLHTDDALPRLVRADVLHVQFETIHPYLDGNGRIGRLLVALLLEYWKVLTKPLFYLSLFFKRHREEYYRRLSTARVDGDREGWLGFFLPRWACRDDEAYSCSIDRVAGFSGGTRGKSASTWRVRVCNRQKRNPFQLVPVSSLAMRERLG